MSSAPFHPTRWTLVRRAGLKSDEGRAALSDLCGHYYEPVHRFVLGRLGDEDEAREATHAFFEELLSRESIGSPDPARGRFRSYLIGAVKHFLARRRETAGTARRGGDRPHVPLHADIPDDPDDHAAFDREWAHAVIRRSHAVLEAEMKAAGKADQLRVLHPWLDGAPRRASALEAAETLALTENAVRVAIHRMRRHFRRLVRAEIEATTDSPGDARDEFRHLVEVLGRE